MRKLLVLLACLGACGEVPPVAVGTVAQSLPGTSTSVMVTSLPFEPSTTCAPVPGAWQKLYDGGPFLDATVEAAGTVAVLQAGRIVRLDGDGQVVGVVEVPAQVTDASQIAALPDGGWLVRASSTVARVEARGTVRWQIVTSAKQAGISASRAPDGTVLILDHPKDDGLRWMRLDPSDGRVLQAVDWPGVQWQDGGTKDIVGTADGTVCAAGAQPVWVGGDAHVFRLACWSSDGAMLGSWQGPQVFDAVRANLHRRPNGTLLADLTVCRYYNYCAESLLDVQLPAVVTSAVLDIEASSFTGNNPNNDTDDNVHVLVPSADGGFVDLRVQDGPGPTSADNFKRTTWERRLADGSVQGQVVLADSASAFRHGGWETEGLDGDASALVPMPDGGWWAVGKASTNDAWSGWIARLPPGTCAQGAK